MKIENATVHGFRSSFRDWAGNVTSFPREVTETALAHVIGDKAEQASLTKSNLRPATGGNTLPVLAKRNGAITRQNRGGFHCPIRLRPHRGIKTSSSSRIGRLGPMMSLTGRLRPVDGSVKTESRSSTRRRIGIQCQGKIIFSKRTVCRAASPRRRRPHRGRAAIASFPFS
jgi:hypothetical protein